MVVCRSSPVGVTNHGKEGSAKARDATQGRGFVNRETRGYGSPMKGAAEQSDVERLARMPRALGDPVRLRILQLLPTSSKICDALYNVCELSEELGIPQPTVSHHLKILRQAGVIRFTKRCNSVYYYLDVRAMKRGWRELVGAIGKKG